MAYFWTLTSMFFLSSYSKILAAAALGQGAYPQGVGGKSNGEGGQ